MSSTNVVHEDYNFIKAVSDFYKQLFTRFKDNDNSDLNDAIVEIGRTEEEQEQLQEMCDEIDAYHGRIRELRESGLTPGNWLEKEIETELEKVDSEVAPESKEEFKKFIFEQFGKDIAVQVEALEEEMDQTVNIAKAIKL